MDLLYLEYCAYFSLQFSVQLDSGQFQENTSEYLKWKEWRERAEQELRHSVRDVLYENDIHGYLLISPIIFPAVQQFETPNLKLGQPSFRRD